MAPRFNKIKNVNNTKIAPEVFSTKPASGKSDHKYICTANAEDGSEKLCGVSAIKATMPIIKSGAVSPNARDTAKIVPVIIPGMESGNK